MSTIGRNIRAARIASGLSLSECAKRINMHPSVLSRVERGQVQLSLERAALIAQLLGVTVDQLLTGDGIACPTCGRAVAS